MAEGGVEAWNPQEFMQKSSTGTSSEVKMKYSPLGSTGRAVEPNEDSSRERMSDFLSTDGGEGEGTTDVCAANEMAEETWARDWSV